MTKQKLVPLELLGITSDGKFSPVVLLKHEDRVLPIMIGMAEADAIHAGLTHRDLGRPMTHDLICNILAGLRGNVKSVVIYKLENDTFFAHLNIEQQNPNGDVEQVLRIDSRPSDGIAIACRVNCPIYAAQEVMDAASTDWSSLNPADETDEPEDQEDSEEPGPEE